MVLKIMSVVPNFGLHFMALLFLGCHIVYAGKDLLNKRKMYGKTMKAIWNKIWELRKS